MTKYYILGGSEHDSSAYYVAVACDHSGYEGEWGSKEILTEIAKGDAFLSLGLETQDEPISTGEKQAEIGLFDDYRIKIDETGIWGWDENASDWVDLLESGGGNLGDLDDVTITSPADDEVLTYDSGSGEWINQSPAATEADLMIGAANKAWIPLAYQAQSINSYRAYMPNRDLRPTSTTNFYATHVLSGIPTNRGGKKLYITGVRIELAYADGTNYIGLVQAHARKYNAELTLLNNGTDRKSAGSYTYSFTAVDVSSYADVTTYMQFVSGGAGILSLRSVLMECYYA